jgi:hypothetical protein
MCTQYLYHIHPPTPFPHLLLLPQVPTTALSLPGRTCSTLPISNFVKEKKWQFCLFKIATQGVSLWHFHVHMHIPHWIHLYFSSFYLSPFLMVVSTGLEILYCFLYREYTNLNFLLLHLPPLYLTSS